MPRKQKKKIKKCKHKSKQKGNGSGGEKHDIAKPASELSKKELTPIEAALKGNHFPDMESVKGEADELGDKSPDFVLNPLLDQVRAANHLALFYWASEHDTDSVMVRDHAATYLCDMLCKSILASSDPQVTIFQSVSFLMYVVGLLKHWDAGFSTELLFDLCLDYLSALSLLPISSVDPTKKDLFPLDLSVWHALFQQYQGFSFQLLEHLFSRDKESVDLGVEFGSSPHYLIRLFSNIRSSFSDRGVLYQALLPVFFLVSSRQYPALCADLMKSIRAPIAQALSVEAIPEENLPAYINALSPLYHLALFNMGSGDTVIPLYQIILSYLSDNSLRANVAITLMEGIVLSLRLLMTGRINVQSTPFQLRRLRALSSHPGMYPSSSGKASMYTKEQKNKHLKAVVGLLSTHFSDPSESVSIDVRDTLHEAFQLCPELICYFQTQSPLKNLEPIERARIMIDLLAEPKEQTTSNPLGPEERAYLIKETIAMFDLLSGSERQEVLFDRLVSVVVTNSWFPFKALLIEFFQEKRLAWILAILSKTCRGMLDSSYYRDPTVELILDQKTSLPKSLRKEQSMSMADYLILLRANPESLPEVITQSLQIIDACDELSQLRGRIHRRCLLTLRVLAHFARSTDNPIVEATPPEAVAPTTFLVEPWLDDLLDRLRMLFQCCQTQLKTQRAAVFSFIGAFLQSFNQLVSGLYMRFLSKSMPQSVAEISPLLQGSGHVWGNVSFTCGGNFLPDFQSHAWLRHAALTPDSRLLLLCYLNRYDLTSNPERSWYSRVECSRWMDGYISSIQEEAAAVPQQP